jgi:hypothetical protein
MLADRAEAAWTTPAAGSTQARRKVAPQLIFYWIERPLLGRFAVFPLFHDVKH